MIRLIFESQQQAKKLIVDLNPNHQQTVLAFLRRVVQIAQLKDIQAQELNLYDQDFLLPHQLPSYCIEVGKVYRLQISSSKGRVPNIKKIKKIDIKINKNKSKIKQSQSSQSSQSSSQSVCQISSSESIISSQLQSYFKNNKKSKVNSYNLSKLQKFSNNIKVPEQKNTKKKQTKKQKISQSESQEHSLQEVNKNVQKIKNIPKIVVSAANKVQIQQKKVNNSKIVEKKLNELDKKQTKVGRKIISNKNKQQDQSSLSSQSGQSPQKYAQTVNSILQKIKKPERVQNVQKIQKVIQIKEKEHTQNKKNQQQGQNEDQKQGLNKKNNMKKQNNPSNIPISVRNKIKNTSNKREENPQKGSETQKPSENQFKPTFKQYQESKWIPVTKEILSKWAQIHQKQLIVHVKNQIRFKIIELDEEKFIPVNSGWIQGFVTQVQNNQNESIFKFGSVVKKSREEGGSSQFLKNYQIAFHNMQEIQIDKNSLTQSQVEILSTKPTQPKKIVPQQKLKQKTPSKIIEVQKDDEEKKPPQTMQQFICGQIHYYFGEKNYPSDLFMQMHANNDAEKYINLKVMLNFPKIKKFLNLNDEEKLWTFLINDDKYEGRNYELDFKRKMIRKK